MLLIAGLGNPGAQYAHNRHNIGFMALDTMQRNHHFSPWNKKFQALISEGKINGRKVLLIKPQTFMNLSGQAVGEAMRFYKIALENLIVIHDELDLPAGKVRIKTGGGSGGHNGIKSIDAHSGSQYRRLRLGIGHPGHKDLVHHYVLGDFVKSDYQWLEPLLNSISDHMDILSEGKDSQFVNKIIGNVLQAKTVKKANLNSTLEKKVNNSPEQIRDNGSEQKPKQQSHIHQARSDVKQTKAVGPMADMLKKLFGNKKSE